MPSERTAGKPTTRRYSVEERAAAVRLVGSLQAESGMVHGAVKRVAEPLGYGVESVRSWVRQSEIDDGVRPGVSAEENEGIKDLEQENRKLRAANEILRRAATFFGGAARPPAAQIVAFIDANKNDVVEGRQLGVEFIWEVLQLVSNTYYAARNRPPSPRPQRDAELIPRLIEILKANCEVYGSRKLWKAARRAGIHIGATGPAG